MSIVVVYGTRMVSTDVLVVVMVSVVDVEDVVSVDCCTVVVVSTSDETVEVTSTS